MRRDDYDDWDDFVEDAKDYHSERSAELRENFDIHKHEAYEWSMDDATLVFLNDGYETVIAKIQLVGTISVDDESWLWAWADESVPDRMVKKMNKVRRYGESHDFEALYLEEWEGDKEDGWEMAAIVAYLLDAEGVYCHSSADEHVFMVITDIYWTEEE